MGCPGLRVAAVTGPPARGRREAPLAPRTRANGGRVECRWSVRGRDGVGAREPAERPERFTPYRLDTVSDGAT